MFPCIFYVSIIIRHVPELIAIRDTFFGIDVKKKSKLKFYIFLINPQLERHWIQPRARHCRLLSYTRYVQIVPGQMSL